MSKIGIYSEKEGFERLVISDENFLGPMKSILETGKYYPKASKRCRVLHNIFARWPVELFIGLRSYQTQSVSIYGHRIRRRNLRPFDYYKKAILESRHRWVTTLISISKEFPGSEISVWQQENLAGKESKVLAEIAGIPEKHFIKSEKHTLGAGPSSRAIEIIQQTWAEKGALTHSDLEEISLKFPIEEHGPFDPWEPSEKEQLMMRYERDLQEISKLPQVKLLPLSENNENKLIDRTGRISVVR